MAKAFDSRKITTRLHVPLQLRLQYHSKTSSALSSVLRAPAPGLTELVQLEPNIQMSSLGILERKSPVAAA